MSVEKWKKQAGAKHVLTLLPGPMTRGTSIVCSFRRWQKSAIHAECFQLSEGG